MSTIHKTQRNKQNISAVQTPGSKWPPRGRNGTMSRDSRITVPVRLLALGEAIQSSPLIVTPPHSSVSTGKVYTCAKSHPGKATDPVTEAGGSACPRPHNRIPKQRCEVPLQKRTSDAEELRPSGTAPAGLIKQFKMNRRTKENRSLSF